VRVPHDEQGTFRSWTLAPENDALLYFAQLMHELVNHQTPDAFRAVSLDSYHRLIELERSWQESRVADFPLDLRDQIEEVTAYLKRDPVVTRNHTAVWDAVGPYLRSASDRPNEAMEAIRLLAGRLGQTYLRECRDYIAAKTSAGRATDKRQFRLVIENYCSHLLNLGYRSESIHFRVKTQFFDRELNAPATRELQNFFGFFPRKPRSTHTVGFAVTRDLEDLLVRRKEFSKVTPGSSIKIRSNTFSESPHGNVFAWQTTALDAVDARSRGESYLTTLRSVAYTAKPYANMQWDPHVVVVDEEDRSVVLREQIDQMRQGRWSPRNRTEDIDSRMKFFLDDDRPSDDRNRILNAVTSYASAFHSESPASQLLSLWSSLEGILPAPIGNGSRISSFARDVRACYTRLYFAKNLETLEYDFYGIYRDDYSAVLVNVVPKDQDPITRLASLICLPLNERYLTEIGSLCANNPLGRQRLYELHQAAKSPRTLFDIAFEAGRKVEWQLRRIYRERNRIVHRASPSENLDLLIRTLNAYTLTVFEAVIRLSRNPDSVRSIDDIFAEIRIIEDARHRAIKDIKDEPLRDDTLALVLGPER
jgi:hypothetical protein